MSTLVALGTLACVTVALHVTVDGVEVAATAVVERVQVLDVVAFEETLADVALLLLLALTDEEVALELGLLFALDVDKDVLDEVACLLTEVLDDDVVG